MVDNSLSRWTEEWNQEIISFHSNKVDKYLKKYIERFEKDKSKELKILAPLCGNSHDLKWLAERGHSVVGVEMVEKAINELFNQHNLSFNAPLLHSNSVYQCNTLPLKIVKCNFFDFPKYCTDKFDLVWDKGSFGAIENHLRKKYADVIKSLYSINHHHLLNVLTYDETEFTGHPYSVTLSAVKEAFGEDIKIELLEREECHEYAQNVISANITGMSRSIFLF